MPILVAGHLRIQTGLRDAFVERSQSAIRLARSHEDCLDFAVSPDTLDGNRVNIFEKWRSRAALEAFRNAGPEDDLFSLVETFAVQEYEV